MDFLISWPEIYTWLFKLVFFQFCTMWSCISRCKMGRKLFSASQQLLLEQKYIYCIYCKCMQQCMRQNICWRWSLELNYVFIKAISALGLEVKGFFLKGRHLEGKAVIFLLLRLTLFLTSWQAQSGVNSWRYMVSATRLWKWNAP